jgi:hypothetical protein
MLDAICHEVLRLTDAEAVVLRQLAEDQTRSIIASLWSDEATETLLGLGMRGLVTLMGVEHHSGRARYWAITDAGRAAMEAADTGTSLSVVVQAEELPPDAVMASTLLRETEEYTVHLVPSWGLVVTVAGTRYVVMVGQLADALAATVAAAKGVIVSG